MLSHQSSCPYCLLLICPDFFVDFSVALSAVPFPTPKTFFSCLQGNHTSTLSCLHSYFNCSQHYASSFPLFSTYALYLGHSIHHLAVNSVTAPMMPKSLSSALCSLPPSIHASCSLSRYPIGTYLKHNIPQIENLLAYPLPKLLIPQPFPFQ